MESGRAERKNSDSTSREFATRKALNGHMLRTLLYPPRTLGRSAVGLSILRATIGLAFVLHGYPKWQHTTSWMTLMMGPGAFAPAWLQALVAFAEFVGGMALILGLLTNLFAVMLLLDMTVAIFAVHIPNGGAFVGGKGSYEIAAAYAAAMLALLLMGPGALSLDARIASALDERASRK
ncbi:MAG: DoxX family protein [Candidatus Eremiobacteraeota bacterium]|nr:DoxX family protein [Candidatus Eremiobacteraeota bacterium]